MKVLSQQFKKEEAKPLKKDIKGSLQIVRPNFFHFHGEEAQEKTEGNPNIVISIKDESFVIYNSDHTEILATVNPKYITVVIESTIQEKQTYFFSFFPFISF